MDTTTRGFGDITLGLLKAAHNLEERLRAKQNTPTKRPPYSYASVGNVVHANRCMNSLERSIVNGLLDQLRTCDPETDGNRAGDLLTSLNKTGLVHYVPVKQATHIDYSKRYPYRSTKRTAPLAS